MNSYTHSNLSKMYQIKAINRLLICHHDCNVRIFPSDCMYKNKKYVAIILEKRTHLMEHFKSYIR